MVRKKAGLGKRHFAIMSFLMKFNKENGFSPSIRQIGDAISVKSTSLVDYYLNGLEQEGCIDRSDHTSRSIVILKMPDQPDLIEAFEQFRHNVVSAAQDILNVPFWGKIYASEPTPVPGDRVADSTIDVARTLLPEREDLSKLYALQVSGDSMIDAMIQDGDIVIMKEASEANQGELVSVWLSEPDETTLKYFYKEKDRIRLQPANPTMGPIYIPKGRPLRIMGKIVLVIRKTDRPILSARKPVVRKTA